jgi:hypothetical protein
MKSATASKGILNTESEYDPFGEGDQSDDNQTKVITILHCLKAYMFLVT